MVRIPAAPLSSWGGSVVWPITGKRRRPRTSPLTHPGVDDNTGSSAEAVYDVQATHETQEIQTNQHGGAPMDHSGH